MQSKFTTETLVEAAVEAVLGKVSREKYQGGDLPQAQLKNFVEQISQLSNSYVNHNYKAISSLSLAEAYALYYMPINFEKIIFLLSHIPSEFWRDGISILDFGCGTGAGIFAATNFTNNSELHGYDRSMQMLQVANNVYGKLGNLGQSQISFLNKKDQTKKFDLIIAANVINESKDRLLQLEDLISSLNEKGVLVVLEPALHKTTRDLMQLRDDIITKHKLNILFPCTHTLSCPMLKQSSKDWCHGTLSWQAPRLVTQIDKIAGFNKHRVKFSALILSKTIPTPSGVRIVGIPRKSKLGIRALVCGEAIYREEEIGKSKHFERY